MNTKTRNRVIYPILIPVAVLGAIAAFVGLVALVLLYTTHNAALMIAAVAAAAILFAVSLAASRDKLEAAPRIVLSIAAAVPFLLGGAFATGMLGDIADEDRNINVEPRIQVPDDAPLIAAENSIEFCMPTEGGCEPVTDWDITPSEINDFLAFFFENREVGVGHNVVFYELDGTEEAPGPGETIFGSPVRPGYFLEGYVSEVRWDELPEVLYFNCAVHPNMNGIARLVDEV